MNKEEIIEQLNLSPHPEGGYYRETYRGEDIKDVDERKVSVGTAIYFLLPGGICTNWHRIPSDELWHFYDGDEMVIEVIDLAGSFNQFCLSDNLDIEAGFQRLVPGHYWQRAYCKGAYSLLGCTVCPDFEFDQFEMIEPGKLAGEYPHIKEEIVNYPFD